MTTYSNKHMSIDTILEQFDKEFPAEMITFEDNMARIETRAVTVDAIKSFFRSKITELMREAVGEDDEYKGKASDGIPDGCPQCLMWNLRRNDLRKSILSKALENTNYEK